MFCVIFRGFVNIMKILLIARQPLTLGFKVWGLGFGFYVLGGNFKGLP